jgi:serine/threonine protein kinase
MKMHQNSKMRERNVRLRYALRLTHILQKERGASVGHYAHSITHPQEIPSSHPNAPLSGIGASLSLGAERFCNDHNHRHSAKPQGSDGNGYNYRDFFFKAVLRARLNTNLAFSMMDNVEGWVASLKRVRNKIDAAVENISRHQSMEGTMISSHKVVVMYNILIGSIIDSLTVQLIQKELQTLNRHKKSDSADLSLNEYSRNHSLVFLKKGEGDSRPRRASNDPISMPSCGFSRSLPTIHYTNAEIMSAHTNMATDNEYFSLAHQSDDSLHLINTSSADHFDASIRANLEDLPPSSAAKILMPPSSTRTTLIPPLSTEMNSFQMPHDTYMIPTKQMSEELPEVPPISPSNKLRKSEETSAIEAQNLLTLLLSFVRLKESTGLERAILCSLMALSTEDDVTIQGGHVNQHNQLSEVGSNKSIRLSTSKLFNDLVVEEANQRQIVRDLQSRSKNIDESLMHMVNKFLSPGHQMRKVQNMIKDFNLEGLQQSMPLKKFWQIITLYIDQLHALELLIVEELGICLFELDCTVKVNEITDPEEPVSNPQEISQHALLEDDNADWKNMSEEAALQELSKMSADKVKHLFLRHIQGANSPNLPLSAVSKEQAVIDSESVRGVFPSPILPKNDSSHSLKEWEIDLYEIEFRQRIGRGVGGTTYLAKWSGQEVAVKVSANTDLGLEGWYTEVHSLRRLHHPNVIRLLGSVYNPSPQTYGLVLEYCHAGDLSAALHRPTPPNFFWKIADDVANGMSYLHRKQILHRDIKPGNVLLDGDVAGGNFTAKLTDFGVAIMHQGPAGEEHTAETGTYRWMSPEVIRHENYSLMTDVYSYALVVWQLVTHEIPFQPMSQLEAAGKVAIENARPPLPPDTPELITALIERCWSNYPDDRLPFAQIMIELKEIHKALSEKDKDWLRHPSGHHVYNMIPESGHRSQVESEDSSKDSKDSRFSKSSKSSRERRSNSREKARRRKSGSSVKKSSSSGFFSLFQKK